MLIWITQTETRRKRARFQQIEKMSQNHHNIQWEKMQRPAPGLKKKKEHSWKAQDGENPYKIHVLFFFLKKRTGKNYI